MTNIKEIVDIFLASKGMKREKGNDGDISPSLPFSLFKPLDARKTSTISFMFVAITILLQS